MTSGTITFQTHDWVRNDSERQRLVRARIARIESQARCLGITNAESARMIDAMETDQARRRAAREA